jgi:hypothetical protein
MESNRVIAWTVAQLLGTYTVPDLKNLPRTVHIKK